MTVIPYNPWKEQLLASLVGPIIQDSIKEHRKNKRQDDLNRETNDILSKVPGASGANTSANTSARDPTGEALTSLAQSETPGMPSPLSSPIPSGATGATGMTGASGSPDIGAILQLLGGARVDAGQLLDLAHKYYVNPMTERLQRQQHEAKVAAALQELGAANGSTEYMKALTNAVMNGAATDKTLDTMAGYFPKTFGAPMVANLGDKTQYTTFNPESGTYAQGPSYQHGVDPTAAAQMATQLKAASISAGVSAANNRRSTGLGYAQLAAQQQQTAARQAALQGIIDKASRGEPLTNGDYLTMSMNGISPKVVSGIMNPNGGAGGGMRDADFLKYLAQLAKGERVDPMQQLINGENALPQPTPYTDALQQVVSNEMARRGIAQPNAASGGAGAPANGVTGMDYDLVYDLDTGQLVPIPK